MSEAYPVNPAGGGDARRPPAGRPVRVSAACDAPAPVAGARALARAFLDQLITQHHLPVSRHTIDVVQLVVSELVTNARTHAPGPCLLTLEAVDGELAVTVRDSRPTPPVLHPPDAGRPGQHGLETVLAVSHRFAVRREPVGKCVTAVVPLACHPPTEPPASGRPIRPEGEPEDRLGYPARALATQVTRSGRCLVARIGGELDHASQPWLRQRITELLAGGDRSIVLDLTAVTFCDSTGLNVLLGAHRDAESSGVALALAGVPAFLLQRLEMTGADQILRAFRTVTDAGAVLGTDLGNSAAVPPAHP